MIRWLKYLGGLCGVGLVVVMGVFLTQPKVREYLYHEASYQVVLDALVDRGANPEEVIRQVVSYVRDQLNPEGNLITLDTDSWTHLVRSFGFCDQQGWTVGTLIALRGIHGRLVMLKDQTGNSPHTVIEVLVDGQWRLIDPLFGLIFHRPDGSLATLEDVSANFQWVTAHPVLERLTPEARQHIIEVYERTLLQTAKPHVRWGSILTARQASWPKTLVARFVHWAWPRLGPGWTHGFQDLYLALLPSPEQADPVIHDVDPSLKWFNRAEAAQVYRLYYRARNYHLYGRLDKAAAGYRQVIAAFPAGATSSLKRVSRMWLGVIPFQQGHPQEAIEVLAPLPVKWPKSAWKSRVYDWLARAYELQGDHEQAAHFLKLAMANPHTPAAARTAFLHELARVR